MLFQVQFLGPARHETLVPILTMLIERWISVYSGVFWCIYMVLAILDTQNHEFGHLNHEFDLFIGDLYRFMQIWTYLYRLYRSELCYYLATFYTKV